MSEPDAKLADAIAQLGLVWDYDDGDVITDAIVIMKIVTENGETQFAVSASDGMDIVTQAGLVHLFNLEFSALVNGSD
jgi:hypothetical protein